MLKLSLRALLLYFFTAVPFLCSAQGLDRKINIWFEPIADWWEKLVFTAIPITDHLSVPIVLLIFIIAGISFTLYFGFVNIRKLGTSIKALQGKFDHFEQKVPSRKEIVNNGELSNDGTEVAGELTHFQALTAAVSGTVGLGNIAGVAVAIAIGGPGATFWMILSGILGMSTKFVECTLGVKYRDVGKDGKVYGGPMYYLSKGFKELGAGRLGKVLAVIFAVMCVGASLGGGNALQSNQAVAQITHTFDLHGGFIKSLLGLLLALLVGIVIIGGIKRIGSLTEKLVPFMSAIYLIGCFIVIGYNYRYIDDAFSLIITQAFSPSAGLGGFTGVLLTGFRRACFSNEAGIGSSPIAHSAVKTRYPASEGLVALLEPFIDTVIVCTLTALTIIFFNSSGAFTYGEQDAFGNVIISSTGAAVGGVELTSLAFDNVIPNFSIVLTMAICLFAFSTMLSWSYYGLQSWKFLFGRSKWADMSYKILFLLFVIIGAATTLDSVIKFSDAMILAMVFPNIIGLIFLAPKVKWELKRYEKAIKKYDIQK